MNRLEKLAILIKHPHIIKNIRVCWEHDSGGNCGRCEKCVRTQMGILSVGGDVLDASDYKIKAGDVLKIKPRNKIQAQYLIDIYNHCKKIK